MGFIGLRAYWFMVFVELRDHDGLGRYGQYAHQPVDGHQYYRHMFDMLLKLAQLMMMAVMMTTMMKMKMMRMMQVLFLILICVVIVVLKFLDVS